MPDLWSDSHKKQHAARGIRTAWNRRSTVEHVSENDHSECVAPPPERKHRSADLSEHARADRPREPDLAKDHEGRKIREAERICNICFRCSDDPRSSRDTKKECNHEKHRDEPHTRGLTKPYSAPRACLVSKRKPPGIAPGGVWNTELRNTGARQSREPPRYTQGSRVRRRLRLDQAHRDPSRYQK